MDIPKLGGIVYGALLLIGLLLLGTAYRKIRSRSIFLLFFTLSGMTLLFDYMVYVWGKAYIYHPGFISGRFDTHLGALINSVVLPATAAWFAAYRRGWVTSILLALAFYGIELYFTNIGVFDVKWWKAWYTPAVLVFYFPAARALWKRLLAGRRKVYLSLSSVFFLYAIRITSAVLMYGVLVTRSYHIGWLDQLNVDDTAYSTVQALFLSIGGATVFIRNARKAWYIAILIVSFASDLLLKHLGWIQAGSFWDSLLYAVADVIPILLLVYVGENLRAAKTTLHR